MRQIVHDHKAPEAQKEPVQNANSSCIVVDTSRKTNMPVSDKNNHTTGFYRIDKDQLIQKKSSIYNILDDASKESYLNKHVKQLNQIQTSRAIEKHHSQTIHMPLANTSQQGLVPPSLATPATPAVAKEPCPSRIKSQQIPLIKEGVEVSFTTPQSRDSPLASPFPHLTTAQRSEQQNLSIILTE
jgi:hypothetical protein